MSNKSDAALGSLVHTHLISVGVETPMLYNRISNAEKKASIEVSVKSILTVLGLDLADDSLAETPARVAKMYVDEIFYGLDYNKFPKCTTVENKMSYDEMVVEKNVNLQSSCEHHLLPISGYATVAYIPRDKVLGLSKINRIVEFFAKRPQIQERVTEQVYHALSFILDTPDVAVSIHATHHCVMSRGIKDTGSSTVTSKLGGVFKTSPHTRSEFLKYV